MTLTNQQLADIEALLRAKETPESKPVCDVIRLLITAYRALTGPGSPYARFHALYAEMEKRFPDPDPFSAAPYEERLLAMLDARLAAYRALENKARQLEDTQAALMAQAETERDAATAAENRAKLMEKERDEWKANHDNQVVLKRMATSRTDLPMGMHPERQEYVEQMKRLEQERDQWREKYNAAFGAQEQFVRMNRGQQEPPLPGRADILTNADGSLDDYLGPHGFRMEDMGGHFWALDAGRYRFHIEAVKKGQVRVVVHDDGPHPAPSAGPGGEGER